MSSPRKVKLGLVGCGIPMAEPGWKVHFQTPSIAWSRYFPQIANNPNAELVAVCDNYEDRAKKAFEVYKAKEYYNDYGKMLDKADIQAVIITTPNKLHAPMAIQAIRAGKHVLVEKPFATTFADADKIVKEAEKAEIKLVALPVPSSCMEAFREVKELIKNGIIGKVCLIRDRSSHGGPGHSKWFYKPGGGTVYDMGVYAVTRITDLIGPAKRVQAFCSTAIPERLVEGEKIRVEVEDNAVISLDFGDGTLASIETNYCTLPGMKTGTSSLEVHGAEGSIYLERWDQSLRIYTNKELYPNLNGWLEISFRGNWQTGPELSSLIDSILHDTNPPYTGAHQRHVVEILEDSLKSSRNRKPMILTSSF